MRPEISAEIDELVKEMTAIVELQQKQYDSVAVESEVIFIDDEIKKRSAFLIQPTSAIKGFQQQTQISNNNMLISQHQPFIILSSPNSSGIQMLGQQQQQQQATFYDGVNGLTTPIFLNHQMPFMHTNSLMQPQLINLGGNQFFQLPQQQQQPQAQFLMLPSGQLQQINMIPPFGMLQQVQPIQIINNSNAASAVSSIQPITLTNPVSTMKAAIEDKKEARESAPIRPSLPQQPHSTSQTQPAAKPGLFNKNKKFISNVIFFLNKIMNVDFIRAIEVLTFIDEACLSNIFSFLCF